MGCTLAKPVVDRVEREFQGDLIVLRVDIQSRSGQKAATEYRSIMTPTFIFFDALGKEQWRTIGRLDEEQLRDSIQK